MAWWWPFGEAEKAPEQLPSVSEHTLADITRGMQHAVNSTQHLIEQHYIQTLEKFLPEGKAITQRVFLPDGQHYLDAPLIAMIPAGGLKLKEMTVEMSVEVNHSVCKKAAPRDVPTEITRTSFEVSFTPRAQDRGANKKAASHGSAIDISMKFVADDPPEGVSRLMEFFTNSLVPKALETGEVQSSTDPDNQPPDGGPESPPVDPTDLPPDILPWEDREDAMEESEESEAPEVPEAPEEPVEAPEEPPEEPVEPPETE